MARRHLSYGVSDQAKASRHRLEDARALFDAKRWRGCMYLAGYAVECTLKTKLMRLFDCRQLRELEDELRRRRVIRAEATVFTHHLESLVNLTNAATRLRANALMWRQFNLVNRWVPAWRYSGNPSNRRDADEFLAAVENLVQWIDHNV